MITKASVEKEFQTLIKQGKRLYQSMYLFDEEGKAALIESGVQIETLPNFNLEYQHWYTKSYYLIKLVAPHRLTDFEELYKKKKGKEPTLDTYCISDALLGVQLTRGGKVVVSPFTALGKMEQQLSILGSVKELTENYFYRLELEIRSDVYDSEIDTAYELLSKRFFRAAGAIAGVVLEKHLGDIAKEHQIVISKKNPTISDFNEKFKEDGIYEVPDWRRIQYLGDLRNICCHDKKIEPTEEQVRSLLDGVKYIIQNIH